MPARYTVRAGDCISSIAYEHGFFPDTLWDHPENAGLKQLRKDPDVLLPDDVVFVPDLRQGGHPCPTNQRHRFRRRSVPAKFSLRLLSGEKPRAGLAYRLEIDGALFEGVTDANGMLEHFIPPNARRGKLIIDQADEEYELRFGRLDPVTEEVGVRQRLENLRYLRHGGGQKDFEAAVVKFKKDHCGLKIPEDGPTREDAYREYIRVDRKMRDKLLEVHGS